MEKNGLEFGNLLIDKDGKERPIVTIEVDGVKFFKYYLNGVDKKSGRKTGIIDEEITPFELINPIPLTEDWLRRFGFKESNLALLGFNGIELLRRDGGYLYWNSIPSDRVIKYVHQLQNLYFALTEEVLNTVDL